MSDKIKSHHLGRKAILYVRQSQRGSRRGRRVCAILTLRLDMLSSGRGCGTNFARTCPPDAFFDLVIAHTVYSHLVDPEGALAEARRVLRPGGQLVIFDGEFATITVALFDGDPLQSAVGAVLRHMMHAPYIMRRLPALVTAAGFSVQSVEPHGYVQTTSPDFLLTLLSRGTNAAAHAGEIGQGLVDGFAQEARRRVANGTFYGAILFLSLAAHKHGQ